MSQKAMNQPIKVGTKTPLWKAQSGDGEIKLEEHIGNHAILIIFYSADWSDVCTEELPVLEELIKFAGKVKLKTFGISNDSPASHKVFAHQIGLEHITLISDPHQEISHAYGMLEENNACKRAALLIDFNGIVQWVRVEPKNDQRRSMLDMELALQTVREWSGYSSSLEEWHKEREHIMQLRRDKALATPTKLDLRFWGTRGSIPVSGVDYQRYGGNTSCVSLTSDTGHLFIFDCGSGARELGNYLLSPEWGNNNQAQSNSKNICGYILLSHTHWDHIQGFPFFGPVFRPGNCFNIIGWSNCSQTLASILAGQMEQIYFPVSLGALPSELNFYSIQYGQAVLDQAVITGKLLNHPIPSTAYRVELGDKIVVYATDHEPRKLPGATLPDTLLGLDIIDPVLVDLAKNADILIHDAQYSNKELREKVGWGHNSAEIAVDTAIHAGVKTLVLYHHDPAHDDSTIDLLLATAIGRKKLLNNDSLRIVAARDGLQLAL